MSIVKYDQWLDRPTRGWLSKFLDEGPFAPFFQGEELWSNEGFVPAVDIVESEEAIKLEAELPGMDRDDISIEVNNGMLTLRGERKHEEETKKENYYRMERRYGAFQRSFSIPDNVAEDKISADYKNGVLVVTLPKTEKAKPKQIKVEVH